MANSFKIGELDVLAVSDGSISVPGTVYYAGTTPEQWEPHKRWLNHEGNVEFTLGCFLIGRYLISGDTLFPGGPGHSNSPDELQQTIASIRERLYTLPDDTIVLPGHGEGTTIGRSREEYAVYASRTHAADLCGDVTWESA